MAEIKVLFLDVGGVLLTNGFDHQLRKELSEKFGFAYEEMDSRHKMFFELFETGKMSWDEYLKKTLFYKQRNFSIEEVKSFVFNFARPFKEMIDFVGEIKRKHHLKTIAVSNEGRELAIDRVNRFNLSSIVDFFIFSSFVHCRKPDKQIYQLAIDAAQVSPNEILYLDDRDVLIEVGLELGLKVHHHKNLETTKKVVQDLLREKVGVKGPT